MVDTVEDMDAEEAEIQEPSIYLPHPPDYPDGQDPDAKVEEVERLLVLDEDELPPGNEPRLFDARTAAMPRTKNTWKEALVYAQGQHFHPTDNWARMCQSFCRSAYGEPGYYATAYLQWLGAPASHKHVGGDPDQAPVGSLLCFKGRDYAGHIDLAARPFPNGTPGAWSNDMITLGKIDKVARTAPITEWGHEFLGWIWTVNRHEIVLPQAPIHKPVVHLDWIVKAAHRDPGAKQGHQTAPAQVKRVEAALHKEGLLSRKYANDGSFGSTTVNAYKRWQHRLGYSGRDADGIPGLWSLRKLGNRHGFEVHVH